MAPTLAVVDPAGMSLPHLPRASASDSGRDPAHVLYDHACDVLVAAQGLRAVAGTEGAEAAAAATFGCLESAMEALAAATESLAEHALADLDPDSAAAARIALQCQDAADVLRVGRDVLGAIRERVGAIGLGVGA
jgi:hypothetical protein